MSGSNCRTCSRERNRRWYAAHSERARERIRRRHTALKREALEAYGGPTCVHCGEEDFKKLSLDHVNGDGAEHREALGVHSGDGFYRKLRNLGHPNDSPLQVLCLSCNVKKEHRERLKAAAA